VLACFSPKDTSIYRLDLKNSFSVQISEWKNTLIIISSIEIAIFGFSVVKKT